MDLRPLSKSLLICVTCIFIVKVSFAVHRPVRGMRAMVATADKYATDVGVNILKNGGNAIDAAVAVGFVLAVTYPQAGNIGGGGFMIIRTKDGDHAALDYREKAPLKANRNMYLYPTGTVIENASTTGYRAVGVPGTVAGLFEAHRKYGSLPWADLVQPAIDFAHYGFVLDLYHKESLESNIDVFLKFESSRDVFTRQGSAFAEGDTLIQSALAQTLERIRDNGVRGFYFGLTAEKIVEAMKTNNGLINHEDLEKYEPVWREPINFNYRGYDIWSMSLPSSGGILLAEILNALENTNIKNLGHNSSNTIHLWVEIEKQAYADRSEHLGDLDYYDAPYESLISKKYGKKIFQSVNPFYARSADAIHPAPAEHLETTHFSIVDENGNAVSNTYTLNGSYGSGVVIEGTGILMNNEMDDFAIKPGFPNLYGLIGGEANAIKAEKRMLSSMTPTIIEKENELFMVLGSPGGSTIITSVAQVISNVLDHGMNIRDAVEAPRFHHQWLPDIIDYEKNGFPLDVLDNLERKGHQLRVIKALGDIQAILKDVDHSEWTGWSDPRRNGLSKGF